MAALHRKSLCWFIGLGVLFAQPVLADDPAVLVGYGDKGFELETADGNFLLQIEARLQFRYAYPGDVDPVTFEDFNTPDEQVLKVNRARLKVGGHGHRPWLKYYFEYELASSNLLDFRVMFEKLPYLKIKVGQWKVQYNRERAISSGKQQMLERSHINFPFTLDRQQGVSLYGHLDGSGIADFNYWASVFMGTGRGAKTNDDDQMMWMGRGQWNFLGRALEFSGSDLKYHEQGAGIIALAAVTNQSPYTRFSQAGGGQLPGFEEGEPGQYRVNQWVEETAFKYRGLAWQQEYHWKRIDDGKNNTVTTLTGLYAQLGYFFHHIWASVPKPLELVGRFSLYDPNVDLENDLQQEYGVTLNWFLNGHRNKLSTDLTRFDFEGDLDGEYDEWRVRLQWDVSF